MCVHVSFPYLNIFVGVSDANSRSQVFKNFCTSPELSTAKLEYMSAVRACT